MQKDRNTTALKEVSFLHITNVLIATFMNSMEMNTAFKKKKKKSQELGHFVGILLRLLMSFASQEKWELILQKICMRKRNRTQMYFDNFLQMRLVNSWLRNNSSLQWIMSMIFRAVKCLFCESL